MNSSIVEKAKKAEALFRSSELCSGEAKQVAALLRKLEKQEITVSVIGQFKRGKSTLVNAILGEELLPVGIVPVTSAVTMIQSGEGSAEVQFNNGKRKKISFSELSGFLNEQENPDNQLGVSFVKLDSTAEFLKDGLTFVDTPGVGSVHKHNSEAAYAFVQESDGVIFMLSVDSPLNEIEIDFLSKTKEYAGKFYFVVNKIDVISQEELEAYLAYCSKLLSRLMGVETIQIFPVSAKFGRGIEELKDRIQKDCKNLASEILEDSAERKLNHIIEHALQQLNFYWAAMKLPVGILGSKMEQLEKRIDVLQEEGKKVALQLKDTGEEEELVARINEQKQALSAVVSGLFEIEYHYETEDVPVEEKLASPFHRAGLDERFLEETEGLCRRLKRDFNRILLYKEESSVTVAYRIDDLNQLTRQLKRLK